MARLLRLKRGKQGETIEKPQAPAETPARPDVPMMDYFDPSPTLRKVTAYVFPDYAKDQWVIRMAGDDLRLPMSWSDDRVTANVRTAYPGYDITFVMNRN